MSNKKKAATTAPQFPDSGLYDFLTIEQILSMPQPKWLIEGIILEECNIAVFGAPESGKSFLALDWALHIAMAGRFKHWQGREISSPGPVVYVHAEGFGSVQNRIRAWAIANGVDLTDAELRNAGFLGYPVNFLDEADIWQAMYAMRRFCAEIGAPPKLMVIDTLAQCFGDGDENNQKDMNSFVASMDSFRSAFQDHPLARLVIHHTGWQAKERSRGSIVLPGNVDTVVQFKAPDQRVSYGKSKKITLINKKQKDGERFQDIELNLVKIDLGIDKNGKECSSCAVLNNTDAQKYSESLSTQIVESSLREKETVMLNVLKKFGKDGAGFTEWLKSCNSCSNNISKDTFSTYRSRMLGSGIIVQNEKRYVYYRFMGGDHENVK